MEHVVEVLMYPMATASAGYFCCPALCYHHQYDLATSALRISEGIQKRTITNSAGSSLLNFRVSSHYYRFE